MDSVLENPHRADCRRRCCRAEHIPHRIHSLLQHCLPHSGIRVIRRECDSGNRKRLFQFVQLVCTFDSQQSPDNPQDCPRLCLFRCRFPEKRHVYQNGTLNVFFPVTVCNHIILFRFVPFVPLLRILPPFSFEHIRCGLCRSPVMDPHNGFIHEFEAVFGFFIIQTDPLRFCVCLESPVREPECSICLADISICIFPKDRCVLRMELDARRSRKLHQERLCRGENVCIDCFSVPILPGLDISDLKNIARVLRGVGHNLHDRTFVKGIDLH